MDTKSKKSRAGAVWLCFFLSLNILFSALAVALWNLPDIVDNYDQVRTIFLDYVLNSDLKDTTDFKDTMGHRFDQLARWTVGNSATAFFEDGKLYSPEQVLEYFDSGEGANLLFYAYSPSRKETVSNLPGTPEEVMSQLPEEYDYYLYYNGSEFTAWKDGTALDIYVNDSGYGESLLRSYMTGIGADAVDISGCRILLVVKADFVRNGYGYSSLYALESHQSLARWIAAGFSLALLLGLFLLVLSILFRRSKREFDRKLAALLRRPWLEARLLLSLLVLSVVVTLLNHGWYYYYGDLSVLFSFLAGGLLFFWWLYLTILDLWHNRSEFFKNNFIRFLMRLYRSFEARRPFQKALRTRVYALILAEAGLGLLSVIFFFFMAGGGGGFFGFLLFLLSFGTGIYLLYRWLRRYGSLVRDLGELVGRIEAVKNGDLTVKPPLRPGADLYEAAENLGRIQEGIGRAVQAGVKSERMKLELVTNVAHDLKTPLTSIVSYADLLATEQDLPEQAREYAQVLVQKSERLKTLILDLFDLSRAASGDMELQLELLDLSKLIEQTLGDLSEEIAAAPLTFRVNLPERPVIIESDGRKLYRVFLNLLTNALKYSLPGSRVFVELTVQGDRAVAAVKNTAGMEMNFDGEEILERFVRGDKARTTEGSGLGLSIAQSFARACGGSCAVTRDGDLFKVTGGCPRSPQQTLPVPAEPVAEESKSDGEEQEPSEEN